MSSDQHVAGLQPLRLGRGRLGRHVVRGRHPARRARPPLPRPRRAAAVLPLRLPVPALAREDASRAGRLRRRRSRAVRDRRRAPAALRPRRLPGTQRVHDRARVRRRRALPRPRRAADLPLREQLLLEGREAGPGAPTRRALAGPRPARRRGSAACSTGRTTTERARDRSTSPDVSAAPWLFEGTGLANGDDARRRGRRLRDRDRHDDAALATGDARARADPEPLRPGLHAEMAYYETAAGARVFSAGVLDFPAVLLYPCRLPPDGQPLAAHGRGPPARLRCRLDGGRVRQAASPRLGGANATSANGIVASSCPSATSRNT